MTRKQLELIREAADALVASRYNGVAASPAAWLRLAELLGNTSAVEEMTVIVTLADEQTEEGEATREALANIGGSFDEQVTRSGGRGIEEDWEDDDSVTVDDAAPGAPPPSATPEGDVMWVDVQFTVRMKVVGPVDANTVGTAVQSALNALPPIDIGGGMASAEMHEAYVSGAKEIR